MDNFRLIFIYLIHATTNRNSVTDIELCSNLVRSKMLFSFTSNSSVILSTMFSPVSTLIPFEVCTK